MVEVNTADAQLSIEKLLVEDSYTYSHKKKVCITVYQIDNFIHSQPSITIIFVIVMKFV